MTLFSTSTSAAAPGGAPVPVARDEDLTHPDLRDLHGYWRQRARDRAMPDRSDIDPAEMVPWLPHLVLVDVLPPFADIRFRVIGTWVVDRTGRDDTGKTMGEIGLNDARERVLRPYLLTAETGRPHRREGSFMDRSQLLDHTWAERLLLPLSQDGVAGAMVLAAIYFLDEPSSAR